MTTLKKWLCLALALTLALSLSACEKEEKPSSQVEESSLVSSEPAPTPEPTPQPESSAFVPAPDLIPPESGETGDFEALFSQNSIDRQYDADYGAASSASLMLRACDSAARRWKDMADSAYEAALAVLDSDGRAALREEQEKWRDDVETEITILRETSGEDSEGVLTAARGTVLLYRQRAMDLCRVVYDATGSLPEFPEITGQAQG